MRQSSKAICMVLIFFAAHIPIQAQDASVPEQSIQSRDIDTADQEGEVGLVPAVNRNRPNEPGDSDHEASARADEIVSALNNLSDVLRAKEKPLISIETFFLAIGILISIFALAVTIISIVISRELAQAQSRAVCIFKSATLRVEAIADFDLGGDVINTTYHVSAEIFIENVGPTPALNTTEEAQIMIDRRSRAPSADLPSGPPLAEFILGGGRTHKCSAYSGDTVTPEKLESVFDHDECFYVSGMIEYLDIYHIPWRTTYTGAVYEPVHRSSGTYSIEINKADSISQTRSTLSSYLEIFAYALKRKFKRFGL